MWGKSQEREFSVTTTPLLSLITQIDLEIKLYV